MNRLIVPLLTLVCAGFIIFKPDSAPKVDCTKVKTEWVWIFDHRPTSIDDRLELVKKWEERQACGATKLTPLYLEAGT